MAKLINLKVDVTKIDKSRLYKGEKGTYLDLVVSLNDEADQFGNDVATWQNQTKDERDAKAQKNYLGNGKVFWSNDGQGKVNEVAQQVNEAMPPATEDDDLPF